jgi:hypothetical protein
MLSEVSDLITPKAFHSEAQGRWYSGAPWVTGRTHKGYAESVKHLWRRCDRSIPNISFVNLDAVFFTQSAKLVLECLATVMLFLIGDVFNEGFDMRRAD